MRFIGNETRKRRKTNAASTSIFQFLESTPSSSSTNTTPIETKPSSIPGLEDDINQNEEKGRSLSGTCTLTETEKITQPKSLA